MKEMLYKNINMKSGLVLIVILTLMVWGGYNWQEKRQYEDYITNYMMSDELWQVTHSSKKAMNVMEEVTSTKVITPEQASTLSSEFTRIHELTWKYEGMAHEFDRVGERDNLSIGSETSMVAKDIASYFKNMAYELKEAKQLSTEKLKRYQSVLMLTSGWYQVDQEVLGPDTMERLKESGIKGDLWVDYLKALQISTVKTVKSIPVEVEILDFDAYLG
ncbi:hypothetical protein [Pontibacillus sp. HMF3514]|uniref:hypothetical protein n=1 Tax=Pontibacillus sp. HMF3514 TaxID=2692425 RepID=UPI00131F727E|nr:hypothetical protein [Pontibacillus sp. HMF3514]QHE51540.1 hypothetical protein GS400_05605 [Pontibacillus sp. HMF3514]